MAFGGIATFFSDHQTFFLGLLNIFLGRPNIFRWLLMSSRLCRSIRYSMTFVARPFLGRDLKYFHKSSNCFWWLPYQSIIFVPTRVAHIEKETDSLHYSIIRGSKKSNIGNRGDELRGAQVIRSYSMLQLLSHPHPLPSLLLPRLHPPCSSVLLFLHSRQCLTPNTSVSLKCLL